MLCAWSCLLAGQASALGVGDIILHSALNQPLDADIELLDVGDLGADEIEVRLAGADVFAAAGVGSCAGLPDAPRSAWRSCPVR